VLLLSTSKVDLFIFGNCIRVIFNVNPDACTLPASLQGSNWNYTDGANEVTVSFGTNTMSGLSYTARGEKLNSYVHIDIIKHAFSENLRPFYLLVSL
jgi:hypothetical protein